MEKVIQVSQFRRMIVGVLSVMAVALLFSCSKNVADASKPAVEEATAANRSSNGSNDNIIHAVPFETTVFVPCANGGAGEDVKLTGFTNFIYGMTWTDHGFTLVYHDNVHQVTGVGLSSGESFVASGGTNETVVGVWYSSQWVGNLITQMKIVGRNSRFTVIYKHHITISQDGSVSVNNTEQTADCN